MDEKEIHRWLKKNQRRYIRLYGLQDWDIQVNVQDTDGEDVLGSCAALYEYRLATITLASEMIDNEAQLMETFLHELEHCLLSPFYIAQRTVKSFLRPTERAAFDSLMTDMNETARSMIGQFRMNVLQLQPSSNVRKPAPGENAVTDTNDGKQATGAKPTDIK